VKLLVVCSQPKDAARRPGPFERAFDSAWADRFLKHLTNQREFCTGCGERCVHCRDWRVQDFTADQAGVIRLPSLLPELLDEADQYFTQPFPPHEVLVAIEIHEELLMELPARARLAGGKAVIVPIEAPDWVSRWAVGKVKDLCRQAGLEVALPKPFCSLEKGPGKVIDAFIDYFHLGKPMVEVETLDGRISHCTAQISAPCGNSHYVAHSLQGYPLGETLQFEVCRYWHSFPCTASMKQDADLGDTILHQGGQRHIEAFCRAAGVPFGRIVGCTPTVVR
jgi:hypothetical protein